MPSVESAMESRRKTSVWAVVGDNESRDILILTLSKKANMLDGVHISTKLPHSQAFTRCQKKNSDMGKQPWRGFCLSAIFLYQTVASGEQWQRLSWGSLSIIGPRKTNIAGWPRKGSCGSLPLLGGASWPLHRYPLLAYTIFWGQEKIKTQAAVFRKAVWHNRKTNLGAHTPATGLLHNLEKYWYFSKLWFQQMQNWMMIAFQSHCKN